MAPSQPRLHPVRCAVGIQPMAGSSGTRDGSDDAPDHCASSWISRPCRKVARRGEAPTHQDQNRSRRLHDQRLEIALIRHLSADGLQKFRSVSRVPEAFPGNRRGRRDGRGLGATGTGAIRAEPPPHIHISDMDYSTWTATISSERDLIFLQNDRCLIIVGPGSH